jgi:fermentation-respiration switch protein FrsA (DUF1100 family)
MNDIDYTRSTRRLYGFTIVIVLAGSVIAWCAWGTSAGGGFALGGIASLANLWIWAAIASGLSGKPGRKSLVAGTLFAGRLLALFAFGYAIVKTLNVQPLAAIVGLLSASLAVIAEILFELVGAARLSR